MPDTIIPEAQRLARRHRRGVGMARVVMQFLLRRVRHGAITIEDGGRTHTYGHGDPVRVRVSDPRTYLALVRDGSAGFGESFTAGWWETDDLTEVVRFAIRNMDAPLRVLDRIARRGALVSDLCTRYRRANPHRDRRNIRAHYDVSNDFYQLMLDETMMYSCAYFATPETSLLDASRAKLDRLCTKLDLKSSDHLVEIGTGWGGFAVHAATHYGCRVTTVTISDAQFEYATELVERLNLSDRVTVLNCDYRELQGTFDKLVSVEMIEAIGWRQLDTYFRTCARLLVPNGVMAVQAITIEEGAYQRTKNSDDFIKEMIFPGGFLPSIESMIHAATATSDLRMIDLEDIGRHYGETLSRWRANLATHRDAVEALGFGPEFWRMWQMYLSYCEAAFLERHISDVQIVFAKQQYRDELGAHHRRVAP